MNFIFFIPDELRAESTGCYGHPLARTPNLDALASQGTRFEQCHVQNTVCAPSRCSLMTGWYPHVRGHRTLWHLLRPDEPNLLHSLKQNGYDMRWFGKNDLLSPPAFADSVSEARNCGKSAFNFPVLPYEDPRYYTFLAGPYERPLEEHSDYANVMAGVRYLQSKPQQPFMLYLPLTFPHPPYGAPVGWHGRTDPNALPALRPPGLPGRPAHFDLIRASRRLDQLDESVFRQVNALYLDMTEFLDHCLGLLLDALAQSGLEEDTAVFFFSDHGDYAGDYGLVEKWPSGMEDVLTRVPLVARIPGGAAGHTASAPVELFDVMATTLELTGIPAGHTHFARSLVPQLQGRDGDAARAVFAEGGYARHEPHAFEGDPVRDAPFSIDPKQIYYPKVRVQQEYPDSVGRAVMIRTVTHKLVQRPTGVSEFYDLRSDPLELVNRYHDPACAQDRAELEQRLLEWYIQTSDVVPFEQDPRGLPA
ncbi:MAG: sulfatase-like hydrolase/transferase [Anaerolineaceae bacterium]|nr:sulfatase-like hydrolase/transferase [Anaerolineaceae bacterium]